ncbi:MAG: caspase family protein [Deltaproteobacteria bacterium]|nr:caspase family protein [Deltaproteobacteria bacterium]
MKKSIGQLGLVILLIIFGIAVGTYAAGKAPVHRFALVVGVNDGGGERARLRYANTDAHSFANVLTEFGGVAKNDLILLTNASKQSLKDGFVRIRRLLKKARASGHRTEVIFYYSGHSDENGLLLQNDIFSFVEMKQQIDTLPARVRIGILDSCASGTLVRLKGGKRTAPFLMDASTEVNGIALLTSSAADEVSQESDKVEGSFFTHYLVSGMRGAADADRDGRITLNESYKYAFDETLHRTQDTQAGAQHPNYDFRLAGSGDVVLTDLRANKTRIIIAQEVTGFIYVRDQQGNLIAEVNKRSDIPVKLGVKSGRYEVTISDGGTLRRGKIRVSATSPARINRYTLPIAWRTSTVSRGSTFQDTSTVGDGNGQGNGTFVRLRPLALGVFPDLSTNGSTPTRNILALNLAGKGHSLTGFEYGYLLSIRTHTVYGIQVSDLYNSAGSLHGGQFALVNVSQHYSAGVQAGLVNVGHTTHGVQGGLVNVNRDRFFGVQGGLVNLNVDMHGLQTGVVNVQKGELKGFQAGLINTGATTDGAQAGLLNVNSFGLHGKQFGLANYARNAKGFQLGLINVVWEDFEGVQLGLINFAGNGLLAPGISVSETGQTDFLLKMGNRYTYSILGSNLAANLKDQKKAMSTIGLGAHLEFDPVWTEIDAIYQWHPNKDETQNTTEAYSIAKLRTSVGYRFFDRLSFFGGISLNNMFSKTRDSIAKSPSLSFKKAHGKKTHYEMSLGWFFGVQWEPKWGNLNSWHSSKREMAY